MRASHPALVVVLLVVPSAVYSEDSGLVGGRVGADLGASTTQPSPGPQGSYRRPPELGSRAGFAGTVVPGQIVPQNVPITQRPGGFGTAFVDGHRVLVGPNSDRILRVIH